MIVVKARGLLLGLALAAGCRVDVRPGAPASARPAAPEVRGWALISSHVEHDLAVIARAREFDVNYLELSHDIVMNLHELRRPEVRERVVRLAAAARAAGIRDVVLWDHALYPLDHYPQRFRRGPGGTLDLDDPDLWAWIKQDYRSLLDLAPGVTGVALTLVETGARADEQHARRLAGPGEKIAAVINAVADVVVGERGLRLHARGFAYTRAEYDALMAAFRLIARSEVRLSFKETPHEFFLTHPSDPFAGRIARPTVIELDPAGEFNGQGIIANTWPELVMRRWGELGRRPHVVGYVARVDRSGSSRILGRPSEILLHALKRKAEDPRATPEAVTDAFIAARYGRGALPHVKAAFQTALDIVTSTLYTLGTSTARHSALDYDPYDLIWTRHVSGKWLDPPVVRVEHGVGRTLDYWRDVVEHLAPARVKRADGPLAREAPWVLERGWVTSTEQMNEEYLQHVAAEKTFGVARAEEALRHIEAARDDLEPPDFYDLHDYFHRTWLTARLHRAVATAYFGYRVWARGEPFRTPALLRAVREALREIPTVVAEIRKHPGLPRVGSWKWATDAAKAMSYYERIAVKGWPEYGGQPFPLEGG